MISCHLFFQVDLNLVLVSKIKQPTQFTEWNKGKLVKFQKENEIHYDNI